MQWLGPEIAARYESTRWPVLLSVCPDIDRMQCREHTLQSAGYVVASASTLFAAQEMCQICSFDLVVLDSEYASEARYLQQRYPSVLLDPGTSERELLSKLTEVLQLDKAAAIH
ncbi:MAG TPA: hypothetical protein VG498_23745 [Terriglobales bacterium]|nr:hypothetical protein [Terriglobales bacterium]